MGADPPARPWPRSLTKNAAGGSLLPTADKGFSRPIRSAGLLNFSDGCACYSNFSLSCHLRRGLLDSITSRLVVGGLLELVWIYVDTSEPVRNHLNVFTSPSRAHCVYGAESETELAEACRPLSALLPAIDPGNVIRRASYFARSEIVDLESIRGNEFFKGF